MMQAFKTITAGALAGALVIAGLLFTGTGAEAAAFLKMDGIDGESTDASHDKWIDVLSVDWGSAKKPSTTASGERLMRPKFGAGGPPSSGAGVLTITKLAGKASKGLRKHRKSRRRIHSILVDIPGPAGGGAALKYELTNVIVSSFKSRDEAGKKIETIVLFFESARRLPLGFGLKAIEKKPERKKPARVTKRQ